MAKRYKEVDPSAGEAFLAMLQVTRDSFSALEKPLARLGISQGRFIVMMLLHREPDTQFSPSILAEKAGVSRATITGLIDGLERDGMVKRIHDSNDRRAIIVRLTPKGIEFLKDMLPGHFQRIAGLMSKLTKKDRKDLIALMEKINQGIPAIRDP